MVTEEKKQNSAVVTVCAVTAQSEYQQNLHIPHFLPSPCLPSHCLLLPATVRDRERARLSHSHTHTPDSSQSPPLHTKVEEAELSLKEESQQIQSFIQSYRETHNDVTTHTQTHAYLPSMETVVAQSLESLGHFTLRF